jgi:predicted enzyme related to lactoylglutathione lyase
LLAQAATPAQHAAIGNQTGGRVAFFLTTNDFAQTYAHYQTAGVLFREQPRHEAYGWVVQFTDCYGNHWDLIGPH